jgi:hypothetical protein
LIFKWEIIFCFFCCMSIIELGIEWGL